MRQSKRKRSTLATAQLPHNKLVDHCAVSFSSNESENCEVGSPICCGNLSKDLQLSALGDTSQEQTRRRRFSLELSRRHTSTSARHKQHGSRRGRKKNKTKPTTNGVSLPLTRQTDSELMGPSHIGRAHAEIEVEHL